MRRMILILLMLVASIAVASWDAVPQPKPAQDIIDALMAVPTPTLDQYGHTERTRVIFNIVRILEVCQGYEARIAVLEKQVAELKVVDPNEVAK